MEKTPSARGAFDRSCAPPQFIVGLALRSWLAGACAVGCRDEPAEHEWVAASACPASVLSWTIEPSAGGAVLEASPTEFELAPGRRVTVRARAQSADSNEVRLRGVLREVDRGAATWSAVEGASTGELSIDPSATASRSDAYVQLELRLAERTDSQSPWTPRCRASIRARVHEWERPCDASWTLERRQLEGPFRPVVDPIEVPGEATRIASVFRAPSYAGSPPRSFELNDRRAGFGDAIAFDRDGAGAVRVEAPSGPFELLARITSASGDRCGRRYELQPTLEPPPCERIPISYARSTTPGTAGFDGIAVADRIVAGEGALVRVLLSFVADAPLFDWPLGLEVEPATADAARAISLRPFDQHEVRGAVLGPRGSYPLQLRVTHDMQPHCTRALTLQVDSGAPERPPTCATERVCEENFETFDTRFAPVRAAAFQLRSAPVDAIGAFSFVADAGPGAAHVELRADSAGRPGTLLAVDETPLAANGGWSTARFRPTLPPSGAAPWILIVLPEGRSLAVDPNVAGGLRSVSVDPITRTPSGGTGFAALRSRVGCCPAR